MRRAADAECLLIQQGPRHRATREDPGRAGLARQAPGESTSTRRQHQLQEQLLSGGEPGVPARPSYLNSVWPYTLAQRESPNPPSPPPLAPLHAHPLVPPSMWQLSSPLTATTPPPITRMQTFVCSPEGRPGSPQLAKVFPAGVQAELANYDLSQQRADRYRGSRLHSYYMNGAGQGPAPNSHPLQLTAADVGNSEGRVYTGAVEQRDCTGPVEQVILVRNSPPPGHPRICITCHRISSGTKTIISPDPITRQSRKPQPPPTPSISSGSDSSSKEEGDSPPRRPSSPIPNYLTSPGSSDSHRELHELACGTASGSKRKLVMHEEVPAQGSAKAALKRAARRPALDMEAEAQMERLPSSELPREPHWGLVHRSSARRQLHMTQEGGSMPQPHHSSAVNSFYPSAQPCSVWRGTALAAPSLSPRAGGHGSEGAPQVTPASPPWSPSNWAPSPAHQGSALHDHNTPTSLGSTYTLTGGRQQRRVRAAPKEEPDSPPSEDTEGVTDDDNVEGPPLRRAAKVASGPAGETRVKQAAWKILDLLKGHAGPMKEAQIRNKFGNCADVSKGLRLLIIWGRVGRTGKGGRHNPFQYQVKG